MTSSKVPLKTLNNQKGFRSICSIHTDPQASREHPIRDLRVNRSVPSRPVWNRVFCLCFDPIDPVVCVRLFWGTTHFSGTTVIIALADWGSRGHTEGINSRYTHIFFNATGTEKATSIRCCRSLPSYPNSTTCCRTTLTRYRGKRVRRRHRRPV